MVDVAQGSGGGGSGVAHLRAGSVSPLATLFQSITFMAPGAAIVFSIGIAIPVAGNSLPISVLLAAVACLFAAFALGQLASAIPSAGGLYAYAALGIGRKAGFWVGWLYVGAALIFPASLITLVGYYIQSTMQSEHLFAVAWWIWALIAAAVVFVLTYFDVRLSTRAGMILGTIEIVIFVALSLTIIFTTHNSVSAFNPGKAPSTSGLFEGAIFGILAFTGFEASAAFGEEARNPRKTVKYAIFLSALFIGVLYVLSSYASVVGSHFNILHENTATGGNIWNEFAHRYWGIAWLLIFFALLNSIIGNSISAINTGSRLIYAMARVGAAPKVFARVHPKHRTPSVGIATLVGFSVVLALLSGAKFGSLTSFGVLATVFTIFAICAYITCSVACINYFRRNRDTHGFKWLSHGVVPVAGILAFLLPLYSQYFDLGRLFHGHFFHLAVPYPVNWQDWTAAAWIGAGVVVVIALALRKSPALSNVRHAFTTDAVEVPAEEPAAIGLD